MIFLRYKFLLLIIIGFFLRVYPINFPAFTADEVRIAVRGYNLISLGKDELSRPFPLIFNSFTDYQLPLVSYFTALGEFIFGKTDFGVRVPFVLLGLILVLAVYKIAHQFSKEKNFWFLALFICAVSPALVFVSRFPNEFIFLSCLIVLIFYFLVKDRPNVKQVLLLAVFSFFVSKTAWFIISPFIVFTLFYFPNGFLKKDKIKIAAGCVLMSILSFSIFLQIPQGLRSLLENNFSIFYDISIKNGIERLRGQGIESHWPSILEKILFNKLHFIIAGVLNWFSQLQPNILFGYFDKVGVNGLLVAGAFQKVLIIPFVTGVIYILKNGDKKHKSLLIYPFLLTFPLAFISTSNMGIVLLVLPFISLIIALGLYRMKKTIRTSILLFAILEVMVNYLYFDSIVRATNDTRPSWVEIIIKDSLEISNSRRLAFSDNIIADIAPFIQWYGNTGYSDYKEVTFPYKVHQSKVSDIKIIGSNEIFYKCGADKPTFIVASKRDLVEIQRFLNIDAKEIVKKVYTDNLQHDIAYLLEPTICVH